MFYSLSKQDIFVNKLIPTPGKFVDIGSNHAILANNSLSLERLGWSGICIEFDSSFNELYLGRTCKYLNQDIFQIDWSSLDVSNLDYLSIDIDEKSTACLLQLPFLASIVTIEHDAYLHGNVFQKTQREYLFQKGYHLLCSNVLVEQEGFENRKCPFEDWWIKPDRFPYLTKIKWENCYPSQIVKELV